MAEIIACALVLAVGGFLALAIDDDGMFNAIGVVMVAGGFPVMVWKAVQGSRRRGSRIIPSEQAPPLSPGDQR